MVLSSTLQISSTIQTALFTIALSPSGTHCSLCQTVHFPPPSVPVYVLFHVNLDECNEQ